MVTKSYIEISPPFPQSPSSNPSPLPAQLPETQRPYPIPPSPACLLLVVCCKSFPLPASPSPSSLHLARHRHCSPSCMWTPTHCTHWRRWSRRTLVCTSLSEFRTDLGDCWLLVSIEAVRFCFRLDIIPPNFPVRTLCTCRSMVTECPACLSVPIPSTGGVALLGG